MKWVRFLTAVLIFLIAPSLALADYWVTYSGNGTIGPIRNGQNVTWSSGDTKVVSEEVIGFYNTHSTYFTVTEVTSTGAEVNQLDGAGIGLTVSTGLTAYATGGQANATALSSGKNNVTTCATAGDSVKLPTAVAGLPVYVKNSGATALAVFPNTSDKIDALAVNLAVSVAPGSTAYFIAIDATTWESNVDNSRTLNSPSTAKGHFVQTFADQDGDTVVTDAILAMGQATTINTPDPGTATVYRVFSTQANDGSAVTATNAELNYNDVTTLGTVEASKTVTADANKDVTGMRNFTQTGDHTVSSDPTGGNAGARSQFQGLPKVDIVALGTMTNGSTETTAYIDATPTGEWAEVDAGTNILITADTSYYRDVTNSVKIAFANTAVENDGVDGTIAQDDLSANESVGFWLYTDATTAVESGDFDLTLDDTDGTDQVYSLPALVSGVWTWVELDISGCNANCDTTDGVQILMTAQGALKYGVSTGEAINLYVDAMYKWDADDEETVSHDLVQDGVLSCMTVATASGSANTVARKTEYTDYFIHYQSGNDAIVTITDQSANSGMCLVAYQ